VCRGNGSLLRIQMSLVSWLWTIRMAALGNAAGGSFLPSHDPRLILVTSADVRLSVGLLATTKRKRKWMYNPFRSCAGEEGSQK
jgi:hypothetical protein